MAEQKNPITMSRCETAQSTHASFKNKPHKFYVVYDDIMDELIVKTKKPDALVRKFQSPGLGLAPGRATNDGSRRPAIQRVH